MNTATLKSKNVCDTMLKRITPFVNSIQDSQYLRVNFDIVHRSIDAVHIDEFHPIHGLEDKR